MLVIFAVHVLFLIIYTEREFTTGFALAGLGARRDFALVWRALQGRQAIADIDGILCLTHIF